jgi:hypothetical protein
VTTTVAWKHFQCGRAFSFECGYTPLEVVFLNSNGVTNGLFMSTVFLDDAGILSKFDPGTWPERYGDIERRKAGCDES